MARKLAVPTSIVTRPASAISSAASLSISAASAGTPCSRLRT
jgi:hypothetical protein